LAGNISPAYFFHSKSVVCDKKIKPSSDARALAFSCNNQNALGHGSKSLSIEQFSGLLFFLKVKYNIFLKIIELD
jgi:hypothetical protein